MAKKRSSTVVVVVLIAVVGLLVAGSFTSVRATGSIGDRTISVASANVLGRPMLSMMPTETTVSVGDLRATITADAVLLPGDRSLPVPAGCKNIELQEQGDSFRVLFDGVAVGDG